MPEAGRSVSSQSFDHSLVYIHSKWCTKITPEIVHQTHVYARLGSVLPTNEFKPIPISSSFSHSSLKSSVLLSDCYRHILYLLLLLFYRILTLNKRTYTHTHISPRCISLNAISLYRNECESGHLHKVLLLRATKGMKSTSFNALCVFECESLFADAQREKVHRAFYHPLQTFHLIYFYE